MGIPTRYNPLGIRKNDGGYGPQDYIVYMSCNGYKEKAESGQTIEYTNATSNNFTNICGISCFECVNATRRMLVRDFQIEYNRTYTMSVWCYITEQTNFPRGMNVGTDSDNLSLATPDMWMGTMDVCVGGYGTDTRTGYYANLNTWYHFVQTFNNGICKLYINGNLIYTSSYINININNALCSLGAATTYTDRNYYRGYIAGARIYNRVLTDSEITTLANEFHPLKDITFTNQSLEFNNDEGATSKALSFNAPYSGYKFTINSGTLPEGVTFNASTGMFTYDGTTILDDEDFTFSITCSGQYMTSATATVTLKMRVEETMPTEGLVLYAPLNIYKSTTDVGSFNIQNIGTYELYNGINCVHLTNGGYVDIIANDRNDWPLGDTGFTYSFWTRCVTRGAFGDIFYYGQNTNYKRLCIGDEYTRFVINNNTQSGYLNINPYSGQWHFVCVRYDNTTRQAYLYVDGQNTSFISNQNILLDKDSLSFSFGNSSSNGNGYFAGVRLYRRVLSDAEILKLSTEYTPQYVITAQDLNCSFYQKNETFGITYSSVMTPTFEIIEGSLPNTITFNTTNGQFSGKGLTDADHTYNLKVRITAPNSTHAECNVTINTYKTARISITDKTFTFYTDGSENSTFEYTSDEAVTFAVDSGSSLPNGITMNGNTFYSDGTTTTGSYSVVVRGTSEHNQSGVTATMNFTINANVITIGTSSLKFFVDRGTTTKQIKYTTSKHAITPVYSMTGTLPNGVTFDASTGTFTNDATQTAATSGTVSVTVTSSTGLSTSATKSIDLIVEMVSPAIPEEDLVVYAPLTDLSNTTTTGQSINIQAITTATVQGIECLYGDKYSLNSQYLISYSDDNLYGSSSRTFSFWVMLDNVHDTWSHTLFCIGRYPNTNRWWRQSIFGIQVAESNNDGISISNATYQDVENKWVFVSSRYNHDSKTLKYEIYIPETNRWFRCSKDQTNYMNTLNNGRLRIWNEEWDARPAFWATAFRAYSRYLDDFEIQQLAAEFTPTDR